MQVEGNLIYGIDKQAIEQYFYTLKSNVNEEERFSAMMFNLKHFFTQNESMVTSFTINLPSLQLFEPYKYELTISPIPKSVYMVYQIENALKNPKVDFEIIDSDILIEELYDIKDGNFVKSGNKCIGLLDYFIFNKNVG